MSELEEFDGELEEEKKKETLEEKKARITALRIAKQRQMRLGLIAEQVKTSILANPAEHGLTQETPHLVFRVNELGVEIRATAATSYKIVDAVRGSITGDDHFIHIPEIKKPGRIRRTIAQASTFLRLNRPSRLL